MNTEYLLQLHPRTETLAAAPRVGVYRPRRAVVVGPSAYAGKRVRVTIRRRRKASNAVRNQQRRVKRSSVRGKQKTKRRKDRAR